MSTTLKGYDKDDDNNNYTVENTLLRFCNVQTLDYIDDGGHPIWKKERKAVLRFGQKRELSLINRLGKIYIVSQLKELLC